MNPVEEKKNFIDSIVQDKNLALSETKQESKISGERKSKKDSEYAAVDEDQISSGAAAPSIASEAEKESKEITEEKVADLVEEKPDDCLRSTSRDKARICASGTI
jgi:hypothetical protein